MHCAGRQLLAPPQATHWMRHQFRFAQFRPAGEPEVGPNGCRPGPPGAAIENGPEYFQPGALSRLPRSPEAMMPRQRRNLRASGPAPLGLRRACAQPAHCFARPTASGRVSRASPRRSRGRQSGPIGLNGAKGQPKGSKRGGDEGASAAQLGHSKGASFQC